MTVDKLVLSHRGALQAKYKAAGLKQVTSALNALVKADARRGLLTQVLFLDDAAALGPLGAKAVTSAPDARQVKAAVDALYKKLAPHYLVLVGAADVVPMVPLSNPALSDGDTDKTVPSDLPYACTGSYSTNPSRFLGPTRVVGRIPDVPGADKPTLLVKLLKEAATAQTRPASAYQGYFGLTAEVWTASTQLSLRNTFGSDTALQTSPPAGPQWPAEQLAPRLHFINCHGAQLDNSYYGQAVADPNQFPPAHQAPLFKDLISSGTVLAVECCYGAELYDPKKAGGTQGIALTYLEQGALGVFGSTTIAYGPSEGNGSADLITQYFLQKVLAGASLGRAALEARLQFAGLRTHLDPFDLKTLAQFYLLGDPSIQPVAPTAHAVTRTKTFQKAFPKNQDRTVRALRREKLERDGANLQASLPQLVDKAAAGPSLAVADVLHGLAAESGLIDGRERSFVLQHKRKSAAPERRLHVLGASVTEGTQAGEPGHRVRAIVVTEQDGQLLHVRRLHSR